MPKDILKYRRNKAINREKDREREGNKERSKKYVFKHWKVKLLQKVVLLIIITPAVNREGNSVISFLIKQ